MKARKVKKGKSVIVYDRLLETNNTFYPIGCTVWVSRRQIRKSK